MLFYFPAEIKLPDLPAALSQWLQLLGNSPLDAVSLMQISVLGWKGDDRYELKSKGGFASYIIFHRHVDEAGERLPQWTPRLSSNLSDNEDEEAGRWAARWFEQSVERN